jgi:hypothetical protein
VGTSPGHQATLVVGPGRTASRGSIQDVRPGSSAGREGGIKIGVNRYAELRDAAPADPVPG